MFSVIVAGRLPLPAPQQIDSTHALFTLEDTASINHVVVFMTGQQAFPPGYAATVHLNWKVQAEDKWLLLGCLKNEKPSSIFRIKGLTQQGSLFTSEKQTTAIGISIETIAEVDAQMEAMKSRKNENGIGDTSGMNDSMQMEGGEGNSSLALVRAGGVVDAAAHADMALALAPRIATNAFSYLSSFAPDSSPSTVPLLKRWLEQFERKVKSQGVGFLAKESD